MKAENVKFIKNRGAIPSEDAINTVIQNQREKGLELGDIEVDSFFDDHNGLKEYLVTLVFIQEENKEDYFNSGEWTTEELGHEDLESL